MPNLDVGVEGNKRASPRCHYASLMGRGVYYMFWEWKSTEFQVSWSRADHLNIQQQKGAQLPFPDMFFFGTASLSHPATRTIL